MSKKTLSPTLIQIRDNMLCGNPDCNVVFKASDSQAFRFHYEKSPVYCSPECKKICMSRKVSAARSAPVIMCGPCPTCGKMFPSKDPDRTYCRLKCWTDSPEFKEQVRQNAIKGSAAYSKKCEEARPICPVCNVSKVKAGNKFCSVDCYRRHLVELFDRWVANPQNVRELNNFDEFLSQEELPCLIEGCTWAGTNLAVHLNLAHGCTARQFKQLVGFNLTSSLITKSHKLLLSNANRTRLSRKDFLTKVASKYDGRGRGYISKESVEHRTKAQALKAALGDDFVPRREQLRADKAVPEPSEKKAGHGE